MAYFEEGLDQQARIGKVIGDVLSALVYLSIIVLALGPMFR